MIQALFLLVFKRRGFIPKYGHILSLFTYNFLHITFARRASVSMKNRPSEMLGRFIQKYLEN